MQVLLVEDQPDIAGLVVTFLGRLGHAVDVARTGAEALARALQREYGLLICDLMLPDLQGTEIIRALKAQSPHLPVIVMSALSRGDWAQPCEDAGASAYLEKPVRIRELQREVELVAKARLHLRIAVVDADPIHATRVRKTLEALGCAVAIFADASTAQAALPQLGVSLAVIDAALDGAEALVAAAKGRGVAVFAVGAAADQDRLLRAGAALLLPKPLDIEDLLTQASFMQ